MTKKPIPSYPISEALKSLQVIKAFIDEGTELDELEATLSWYVINFGEEIVHQITTLDDRALAGKERKQLINEIQKTYENRSTKLKKLLVEVMRELELKSFDGGVYGNINLMDATQPKLEIVDEGKIPKKFFTTEVIPEHSVTTLDKEKLKGSLMAGEKIEGAKIETSQYIRIGHKIKQLRSEQPPELTEGVSF